MASSEKVSNGSRILKMTKKGGLIKFNTRNFRAHPIACCRVMDVLKDIFKDRTYLPGEGSVISDKKLKMIRDAYSKPLRDGERQRRKRMQLASVLNLLMSIEGMKVNRLKPWTLSSMFTYAYYLHKNREKDDSWKAAHRRMIHGKTGILQKDITMVLSVISNSCTELDVLNIRKMLQEKAKDEMMVLLDHENWRLDECTEDNEESMNYYFKYHEMEQFTTVGVPEKFLLFENEETQLIHFPAKPPGTKVDYDETMASSRPVLRNPEKSILDQSTNEKNPNTSKWTKQPINRVGGNYLNFYIYSLRSLPITAHNLIASVKNILPGYTQVPFDVEVSQGDLYCMLQAYKKPLVDGGRPRRNSTKPIAMKNLILFLQGAKLTKLKAHVLSSFFTFCYFLRKYRNSSTEITDAYTRVKNGIVPSKSQILAVSKLIVEPGEKVNEDRIRSIFRYKNSVEMKELFNSNQTLLDGMEEDDEACMKYYFRCFEIETPIERPGDEFVVFRNKAGEPLYVRGRELLTLAEIDSREAVRIRREQDIRDYEDGDDNCQNDDEVLDVGDTFENNDYCDNEDNFDESDISDDEEEYTEDDDEKHMVDDNEEYIEKGEEEYIEKCEEEYVVEDKEEDIEDVKQEYIEEDGEEYIEYVKEEYIADDDEEYIIYDEELNIEDNKVEDICNEEKKNTTAIQEEGVENLTMTYNQCTLQASPQSILGPSTSKIYRSFEKYFNSERRSDVKFVFSDGRCIHAHSIVLETKSNIFADMFSIDSSVTSPGIVNATDIDYEVVYEAVRFIYTDKVQNLDKFAAQLLEPAKRFMLQDLKILCEEYLCKKLSIVNIIDSLILAEDYNLCVLKEKAMKIVVKNMKDIVHLAKFENLMIHHPKIALEIVRCSAAN